MAFLAKLGPEEISELERTLRLTTPGLALPSQTFRFCTATNGVSAFQGNGGLRVRMPSEHVACLVLRQVHLDVELVAEALLGPAGRFIETLIIAADIRSGIRDILKSALRLSLRSLILRGVKLDEWEVSQVSELVCSGKLQSLQVHKASFGDHKVMLFVSSLFGKTNSLTHLSLARNGIRLPGAAALAPFIMGSQALTSLSLTFNPLGSHGVLKIASALHQSSTLTELNLSYTAMGKEGAAFLEQHLQHVRSLQHLLLGGNCVGEEGAAALLRLARALPNLCTLCLHNNHLRDGGVLAVLSAVASLSLRRCDISLNQPSPASDRALLALALSFARERDLLAPLPAWLLALASPAQRRELQWQGLPTMGRPRLEEEGDGGEGGESILRAEDGGSEGKERERRGCRLVISHQESGRLLAFAMGQHSRLGAGAACGALSEALLHHLCAAHWPCQPRELVY